MIQEAIFNGDNYQLLANNLKKEKVNYIDDSLLKELMILGLEKSIEKAFEDNILSEEEEKNLEEFKEYFKLGESLKENEMWNKVGKGQTLRLILNNQLEPIYERFNQPEVLNQININLQKNEKLIFCFQSNYYEEKKRIKYVGGSIGGSIRVAKGIYLRQSAFKGKRVEHFESELQGIGLLIVTNKHIYFDSEKKSFRIKYDKIVSIKPLKDGVIIQKDGVTAKPQSFITNDGWFTYNLIANVARIF